MRVGSKPDSVHENVTPATTICQMRDISMLDISAQSCKAAFVQGVTIYEIYCLLTLYCIVDIYGRAAYAVPNWKPGKNLCSN